MRLSWDSDACCVDATDQVAPISGPLGFSFAANGARGFFVEVANGCELRTAYGGERSVNARVLAAKATDSDDCCA
jgi:hypothetical protein